MIIQLPVTSEPAQQFTILLGTQKWDLYVRYNDRGNFWTMDIMDDATQTSLITGMPLLLGCDLLEPYNLDNGAMIAYDTTGSGADAGPDDLGDRVLIYWFSADQVASTLAGVNTTT